MKLITKDVDYAVKTLKYMAGKSDHIHTVADLAEELDISLPYLRKILQRLSKQGVVLSIKGKSGGFSLHQPPEQISLYDLILTLQGDLDFDNCMTGSKSCPERGECLVRQNVQDIEKFTRERFKSLTLGALLACPGPEEPVGVAGKAEPRIDIKTHSKKES